MFKFFIIYLIYRFHIDINIKKKIIRTIIEDMKNKNQSIYNEDNFYDHLKSFKKLKKVVFSVLLGEYDLISQFNLQKDFDFFLFTDDQSGKYNHTNWTILPIPAEVQELNVSRVKKQRFIKLHPHLYFKDYDLSIYIDANFKIVDDLNNFLIRVLSPNYSIYTFEHPGRNTIFNETFEVVSLQKEKESIAKAIRERYRKENFPDKNGLIESCLIIRKHNEKDSIYMMNKWYDEIKNYSHRDQLSFNYIMWKTGVKIKYIVKNFALQYFFQNITHLELLQIKN
jgi:hypothetical protein